MHRNNRLALCFMELFVYCQRVSRLPPGVYATRYSIYDTQCGVVQNIILGSTVLPYRNIS